MSVGRGGAPEKVPESDWCPKGTVGPPHENVSSDWENMDDYIDMIDQG